jgi:hypothetical protein
MEIKLLTIALCLFLLIPIQIHVGSAYWLSYLVLVYFITFPSAPVPQILKRLKDRHTADRVVCSHCDELINEMDVMCSPCKIEVSMGSKK